MRARVRVFDGADPGAYVTLSFTEFVRARTAGLRRLIALFGADDGGAGLYASGPDRDLLGRPVSGLGVAPRPAGRLDLDSTQLLTGLRAGAPIVPAFVTGRVDGAGREGSRVAVAINGRVRGVSVAFPYEDELRVAAMVPAGSFRRGSNVVDAYLVAGQRRRAGG